MDVLALDFNDQPFVIILALFHVSILLIIRKVMFHSIDSLSLVDY